MATSTSKPTTRRSRKKPNPKPGGRPSKLDQKLVVTRNGQRTEITVADRIIEYLRGGAYVERACAAVDVRKGTFYGWLQIAGQARSLLVLDDNAKLTDHQRRCLEFSDAVDRAEAEYEIAGLLALEQLAQGVTRETVTERWEIDSRGEERLIERKVVRSTGEPSVAAITWKLTRRFPERYQTNFDPGAAAASGAEIDLGQGAMDDMVADIDRFLAEVDGSGT